MRGVTGGFPKVMYAKVTYQFDRTAIVDAAWILRGNGCFDPEQGVGGGQPKGWAQYKAIYKRYKVTGAKCNVEFTNLGTGKLNGHLVAADNDTSLTAEPFTDLVQLNSQRHTIIGSNGTGGATTKRLSMYRKSTNFYPNSTENLSGLTATTNPAQQWYFHIVGHNSTSFVVNAKLTYYVKLFNPHSIEQTSS